MCVVQNFPDISQYSVKYTFPCLRSTDFNTYTSVNISSFSAILQLIIQLLLNEQSTENSANFYSSTKSFTFYIPTDTSHSNWFQHMRVHLLRLNFPQKMWPFLVYYDKFNIFWNCDLDFFLIRWKSEPTVYKCMYSIVLYCKNYNLFSRKSSFRWQNEEMSHFPYSQIHATDCTACIITGQLKSIFIYQLWMLTVAQSESVFTGAAMFILLCRLLFSSHCHRFICKLPC